MEDDRIEVEEGKEVVRRTIVGGRPLARRKRTLKVPVGIEKVLCRAAADPAFRAALLDRRPQLMAALGTQVSPSEADILGSIPRETLAAMIARIDLDRHSTRRFMKGVLNAAMIAAASTAVIECSGCGGPAGIQPTQDVEELPLCGGADSYVPPDVMDNVAADLQDVLVQADEIGPDQGNTAEPPPDARIENDEIGPGYGNMADPPADIQPADLPAADVQPPDVPAADVIETEDLPAPGGILPDVDSK